MTLGELKTILAELDKQNDHFKVEFRCQVTGNLYNIKAVHEEIVVKHEPIGQTSIGKAIRLTSTKTILICG